MNHERVVIYIIDSSSLIDIHRFFPADIFVGVWQKLDDIIQKERLFLLGQVRDEIVAKNDFLHGWISKHDSMVIQTTDTFFAEEVKPIVDMFPLISHVDNEKTPADPYLIAYALYEQKQTRLNELRDFFIVTEEKRTTKEIDGNTMKNVKKSLTFVHTIPSHVLICMTFFERKNGNFNGMNV